MKTGDLLSSPLNSLVVWNADKPNSIQHRVISGAGPFICCGTCSEFQYLVIILTPNGTLIAAHSSELRCVP